MQKALFAKSRDVSFSIYMNSGCIRPTRVEVQSEHITVSPLRVISDGRIDLIEVIQTRFHDIIIVRCPITGPSLVVEILTGSVHDTLEHNDVPFVIIRAISDNADKDAPTLTYDEFLPLAIRHSFTLVCKMLTLIKENDKLSLG